MKVIKQILKDKNQVKLIIVSLLLITITMLLHYSFLANKGNVSYSSIAFSIPDRSQYVYLSDLEYITENNWSYNGWSGHNIQIDKNQDGGTLSLIVDGELRTFSKGVGIHAKGQVTYDISSYSADYTRFIAKIGVDATRTTNGSIWFQIYVSNDGNDWTSLLKTETMSGISNAVDVDLDIEGYKYLRIYVDPVGANTADHGTVANARLVTKDYINTDILFDKIEKVEYYDNILKSHDADYNYEHNYRLILEREFVNKMGYWTIENLAEDPNIYEILEWILSENRILEEVIEVGEISNSTKFLQTLSSLYATYKDDLNTQDGDVFEKMMIGLSAAFSTDTTSSPLTFSHYYPTYDFIERYSIFRDAYTDGLFLYGNGFKEYHVELFRIMMQDGSRNDELLWLNYIGKAKNYATGTYSYVAYISPNYSKSAKPHLYDPANEDLYNTKYKLSDYGVPFADDITRYWMVMQEGGICWNQARFIAAVFKMMGRPSIGTYQPSHESALYYISENPDGTGEGSWGMAGNIFGWGSTANKWYGGNRTRTLFGWSNKSFTNQIINASNTGNSAGYVYLAQENLNRYADYKKSLYLNLLANSYDDYNTKVNIYNKALAIDEINLDSYDYKIQAYKSLNKSTDDWYSLALDIIDNYTFYPMAMHDLLEVIRPYLSGAHRIDIDLKEYDALVRGTKATAADNKYHWSHCTSIANAILKKANADLASFSFDGENAGQIVISSAYKTYTDLQWHYSLDGGKTKSAGTTEHSLQLSASEIAKINAEDDIRIYIDGLPGDALAYTIDIVEGTLPTNLYGNDLENRVVGVDLTFEWRNSENDEWTSYAITSPDNTGNKTLYVRVGATGNKLPSESTSFNFTADNQPDTRKYVAVSHLTIDSYSTQSVDSARPYYAPNAIDGNINTLWHTDFRYNVLQSDTKPFITIKLDKVRYISAIEFIQTKYRAIDPDYIKNATIFISEDGETWIEAGKIEDCPQDNELRTINFNESIEGSYIKIELDTYDMFASLAMVNVFQDMTKNPRPTGGVGYSTTDPTTGNVIARLVNVSVPNYEITSPGGDTHEFTENGEFTFTFVDTDTGVEGSSVAKVDWIDRIAPTATIEYSATSAINSSVFATLKPSEDVIVTNNGEYRVDDNGHILDINGDVIDGYKIDSEGNITDANGNFIKNINTFTYEFIDNGEFTFEFVDKAGNKGTATATVTWIDHDAPEATLTFDRETLTNQDVTVTIDFNENTTILNNNGSASYTFKENGEFTFSFEDAAGNVGTATANVTWIDKIAPIAELKYEKTGDKVIVTVINPSEEITYAEGIGVYEFIANGNYEIIFYDKAGNVGSLTAVINSFASSGDNNPGTTNPVNPGDSNNSNNPGTINPGNSNNNNNNSSTTNPGNSNNSNQNNSNGSNNSGSAGSNNNQGSSNNSDNFNNSNNNNNSSNNTNNNQNNSNGNNSTENNGNINNGETTNPGTNNSTNISTPINMNYEKYSIKSISVEVLASSIPDEASLNVDELELPENLKSQFDELSECYDIYFTDENGNRVATEITSPTKISIKLRELKEFIGVYEITDDNTIKIIEYVKNGNTIEIATNNIGKYIVSYKELTNANVNLPIFINSNTKKVNLMWTLASIEVLTLGAAIYFFQSSKMNKKSKEENNNIKANN